DSVTSVQIMELIKEIAKDKLVVMVTHNPELAKDYANRIIELKDGEILSDSNPIKDNSSSKEKLTIKKTVLGYGSALKLSFSIIGIALILSLSNGFQMKIDEYEVDTLSQMPITISTQAMNVNEDTMQQMNENRDEHDEYSDSKVIYPRENSLETMMHFNTL